MWTIFPWSQGVHVYEVSLYVTAVDNTLALFVPYLLFRDSDEASSPWECIPLSRVMEEDWRTSTLLTLEGAYVGRNFLQTTTEEFLYCLWTKILQNLLDSAPIYMEKLPALSTLSVPRSFPPTREAWKHSMLNV